VLQRWDEARARLAAALAALDIGVRVYVVAERVPEAVDPALAHGARWVLPETVREALACP